MRCFSILPETKKPKSELESVKIKKLEINMEMKEFNWTRVEEKRKPWEPNSPKPNTETLSDFTDCEKLNQVMSRCLALTPLEPAVADFITEGLDRIDLFKVSDAAINTLTLNIQDEVKHELALTRSIAAWKDYDQTQEVEAAQFINRWTNTKLNPILVSAVLEQCFLMQGLVVYSRFGGLSLRVTAQDISADEVRHASSNKAVAMLLGERPTKSLLDLLRDTVAWAFDGLNHRGLTQERMLKNSLTLLKTGKSDFTETAEGVVYAPFEIKRNNASAYA